MSNLHIYPGTELPNLPDKNSDEEKYNASPEIMSAQEEKYKPHNLDDDDEIMSAQEEKYKPHNLDDDDDDVIVISDDDHDDDEETQDNGDGAGTQG